MQKLDFTEHVNELREILNSDEIIKHIDGISLNAVISGGTLTPFILESNNNYVAISPDQEKLRILNALGADEIYASKNMSNIINVVVSDAAKVNILAQQNFFKFYVFHSTLIQVSTLCEKVLLNGGSPEMNEEDTIVFRILIEGDLEISRYTRILTLINELVGIIQKVNSEEESEPVITLFDSGSDTNLGVKTTVETARSLFQIFKEVWDSIVNHKFYKNKLRNETLLDNLKVMTAIKEAKDNGVISEDDALIYKEQILRKTEDLLELNVVPRVLVLEDRQPDDAKKLLDEYKEETKLLQSGKGE